MANKGATAMKHARAWVEQLHPGGALTLEAGKKIFWIVDKENNRIPRARAEDLFGVFDIAVFPLQGRVQLIQVTTLHKDGTDQSDTVGKRRRKVRSWIEENIPDPTRCTWLGHILVIGWIPRKRFRLWEWDFSGRQWVEVNAALVPIPKSVPANALPGRPQSGPSPSEAART